MSGTEPDSDSRMPNTALDKDREDKTRSELRGTIAKRVGARTQWGTPLDKDTLNSVYAYLSGGFHVPPSALNKPEHPDFEDRKAVLIAVVSEARILGAHNSGDWRGEREYLPSQLRRAELAALLTEMGKRGDQRGWLDDE